MACGDSGLQGLAQAVAQIAVAISTSKNCCDGNGSGGSGQSPEPINETPEGNPAIDPPPEGFDSWEEFFADKCAKAAFLVNQLKEDLADIVVTNLEAFGISTLATFLAIAFATPIPFDDVLAVAALLISIGSTVLASTALSIINDNEEAFICELFNGDNAANSQQRFLDLFSEFASAGTVEPVTFSLNALMSYMLSNDSVNRLYLKDETRAYAEHDCSECPECETLVEFTFEEGAELWGLASETCDTARVTTSGAAVGWTSDDGGSLAFTAPATSPEAIVVAENDDLEPGLVLMPEHQIALEFQNGPNNVFCRLYVVTSISGCNQVSSFAPGSLGSGTHEVSLSAYAGEQILAIQLTAENSINQDVAFNLMNLAVNCSE